MFPEGMRTIAMRLLSEYAAAGLTIATAESCTGGMVAAVLTDIAGSSRVFERGFVTYSNTAKTEMLGVPAALIAAHGAVSAEVAVAMAAGAINHSTADVTVAITGIAGPDGGSETKPVGRVHIATAARRGPARHKEYTFTGDRAAIRNAALIEAIERLRQARPNASPQSMR